MKETKFRFYYLLSETGIHKKVYHLEDLMNQPLYKLSDIHNQGELIAKAQYIGLKDKNGVEIFEGDIVKNKDWRPVFFEVVFCEGSFGFSTPLVKGYVNDPHYLEKFEIVGNIYQNKELL